MAPKCRGAFHSSHTDGLKGGKDIQINGYREMVLEKEREREGERERERERERILLLKSLVNIYSPSDTKGSFVHPRTSRDICSLATFSQISCTAVVRTNCTPPASAINFFYSSN